MNILITGDYVPSNRIQKKVENNDFSFFNNVKEFTTKHDLSIINLEAPVINSLYSPIYKCGPNLSTVPNAINSLKYAGFNMVTLANNHILDYGEKGLKDTLKICKDNNIITIGAGINLKDASSIKYFNKDGKVLAIINCCEHEFSIAKDQTYGACPLDLIIQYNQIQEAKNNADFVLLIAHGGHERHQYPSRRMVETYRHFVDLGVDVIINHHQHCFSGYEIYKGKPIFYGIGNFCFDNGSDLSTWHEGYMVSLNFSSTNLVSFTLIPYTQCDQKPTIDFLNDDVYLNRIENINKIITDLDELDKVNHHYYDQEKRMILRIFEPYRGRILNKLFSLGILPSFLRKGKKLMLSNYINCESHRDKLSYLLENS